MLANNNNATNIYSSFILNDATATNTKESTYLKQQNIETTFNNENLIDDEKRPDFYDDMFS